MPINVSVESPIKQVSSSTYTPTTSDLSEGEIAIQHRGGSNNQLAIYGNVDGSICSIFAVQPSAKFIKDLSGRPTISSYNILKIFDDFINSSTSKEAIDIPLASGNYAGLVTGQERNYLSNITSFIVDNNRSFLIPRYDSDPYQGVEEAGNIILWNYDPASPQNGSTYTITLPLANPSSNMAGLIKGEERNILMDMVQQFTLNEKKFLTNTGDGFDIQENLNGLSLIFWKYDIFDPKNGDTYSITIPYADSSKGGIISKEMYEKVFADPRKTYFYNQRVTETLVTIQTPDIIGYSATTDEFSPNPGDYIIDQRGKIFTANSSTRMSAARMIIGYMTFFTNATLISPFKGTCYPFTPSTSNTNVQSGDTIISVNSSGVQIATIIGYRSTGDLLLSNIQTFSA